MGSTRTKAAKAKARHARKRPVCKDPCRHHSEEVCFSLMYGEVLIKNRRFEPEEWKKWKRPGGSMGEAPIRVVDELVKLAGTGGRSTPTGEKYAWEDVKGGGVVDALRWLSLLVSGRRPEVEPHLRSTHNCIRTY